MAVAWSVVALSDLVGAIQHIAADDPAAARRIGQEILLAGDSLSVFPDRGRRGRIDGTRELASVPPYILVYRVDPSRNVTVVRVWHAARDTPVP